MKKYIYIISLLLISCQEEITLDLPNSQDKIVVEGSIENGFPPIVILTKNQGYFDGSRSLRLRQDIGLSSSLVPSILIEGAKSISSRKTT